MPETVLETQKKWDWVDKEGEAASYRQCLGQEYKPGPSEEAVKLSKCFPGESELIFCVWL